MFFSRSLEIRRFRTNLRRLYLASMVLFASPEPVLFSIGAGLVAAGVLVHFWSAGYLTRGKSLVVSGPYSAVRNPFYSAAIIIDLGFGLASRNWIALGVFLPLISAVYLRRILGEERALEASFGDEYRAYKAFCRTRLLPWFPNLFRTAPGVPVPFSFSMVIKNREIARAASHVAVAAVVGIPMIYADPWEWVSLPVRGIVLGALAIVLAAMSVRQRTPEGSGGGEAGLTDSGKR